MDDDTFASLEEISDEQTLERLESLFESTSSFPSLDSPSFGDDQNIISAPTSTYGSSAAAGTSGNVSSQAGGSSGGAAASTTSVGGTQDLFSSQSEDAANMWASFPMQAPLAPADPVPPSPASSNPPPSPAATPTYSTQQTRAPSVAASLPSTSPLQAPSPMAPPQPQIVYATKSAPAPVQSQPQPVARPSLPASSLASTQQIILNPQPTSQAPGQQQTPTFQLQTTSSGQQQLIQMQLQPNQLTNTLVGATSAAPIRPVTSTPTIQPAVSKQQPHLLPKPPLAASVAQLQPQSLQPQPQTVKLGQPQLTQTAATISVSSASGPLILNQGNVLTTGQSPQFLLNSMGQIVGQANSLGQVIGQAGTTALGQVNSLGQVVGQTNAVGQVISQTAGTIVGQAAPAAQSQPFLIQQPGGNQILVMRPQAPAIQQQPVPTILQPAMTAGTPGMIATAAAANGQNNAIFMQPPTPTGAITAQPSIKLITPQGQRMMMKMQTPQGPKFVAVPISAMNVVGQPAAAAPTAQLTLPNGQIVVSGSQSLQPAAASLQPQQQQLMTWAPSSTATLPSSLSSVIMSSAALQPTSSTLISSPLMSPVTVVSSSPYGTVSSTPVTSFSGSKKKKSKKRKRDESEGGLDLGAVIKDAGLDLEEFGLTESGEQQTQNQLLSDVSATAGTSASSLGGYKLLQTSSQLPPPTQTQQPQFTATAVAASPSVPQHAQLVASSSGSQLVAQIQQPLPIQPPTPVGQFQLVQGADGQFILQQSPVPQQAQTIIAQTNNLSAAGINLQPTLTATPQFIASTPTSMTLPSVSVATAVAPQLQNNAIAAPPVALTQQTQPPLTILPSATQITPGTSVATGATSPTKTPTSARRNLDPNRVPLYEDERLPQGWHRKVSQRKSGASAGRYEVFIIGPNGKRFRSRNELKAFFDKTGEKELNPEDFDFSTFGTGTTGRTVPNKPQTQSALPATVITPAQPSPLVGAALPPGSTTATPVQTTPLVAPATSLAPPTASKTTLPLSKPPLASIGVGPSPAGGVGAAAALPQMTLTDMSPNLSTLTPNKPTLQNAPQVPGATVKGLGNSKPPPNLLQSLQEPLPPKSLEPTPTQPTFSLPRPPTAAPVPPPPQPSFSQQPTIPPSSNLSVGTAGLAPPPPQATPSSSNLLGVPTFTSQLSRDIAEDDAQITHLLETLQKDPQSLSIESEKMADLIKSLSNDDDVDSKVDFESALPPPVMVTPGLPPSSLPTAAPPVTSTASTTTTTATGSSVAAPMTVIPATTADSVLNKPELAMTTGTSGFQASFLNSIASRRFSAEELEAAAANSSPGSVGVSPKSPDSDGDANLSPVPQNVIQSVSSADVLPASLPPTTLNQAGTVAGQPPVSGNQQLTVGGPSTQMRAFQNLPPNTRIVRGPNGQYSLQKVQTIELTVEMQQNLRLIQARVQEIENKASKTPQDEAELATLQTKQQQILATGRPVPVPATGTPAALSNSAISPAGGSAPTPQTKPVAPGMPKMSSQVSPIIPTSSSMAPPIAGGAASQNPVRFAHNVSNQVISVSPSSLSAGGSSKTLAAVAAMPGQSSSTVEPPPSSTILKPSTPSPLVGATTPGVVPALTDEQKQIILDFKQSMVGLTPEARDKFIAQHKGRLMEKLNFQPKQLKSLRSNQAAVVGGAGTSPAGASLPTAPQPMTTNIPAGKPPAAVLRGAVPPLNPLPGQSSKHNAPLPPGIVSQLQNPQSMPGLGSQMSPMPPGLANLKPQKISIGTPGTGAAMPRLEDASVMMLPSVPTSSGINNGGSSALKRPLSGTEPTMPIHTKIRWVESQLGKDQNEVLNPQYKVRFKDKEDSCKKLLRFHVYHELDVSPEQIEKEEVQIESKATELMDKYNTMLNKYHYLLLQESMRSHASSEDVMLARLWDSDERQSLSREKEEHKTAGKIPKFPSLPESWKGKYVELTGHQPPEGGTAGLLEQEEEEEAKAAADEENGPTEGLDNGTLVPEDIVVPGVTGKLPVSNQPGDQNKQPSQQGLIPQDLGPPILEPQIQLPTQPEPFDPNAAPAITSSSKGGSGVGIIDPAEIEDSSDESKFLGLKFARSHSGNWMSREGEDNNDSVSSSVTGVAVPKDSSQDEAYDEFSAIQMAMSDLNPSPDVGGVNGAGKAQLASVEQEKKKMTVSSYEDLNEEEEFSLKSISTSASDAVGSILDAEARSGGRTGTSGGGEDFEFDRFDTPTIGMVGDDGGDNDSVQNAINSILDLPQDERMETPDLNNIAGLLDSMEREQQEQDPATEAAVNSIPRF